MVMQLPISWVKHQLDPLPTLYIKTWAGLARCANSSILFLSQANGKKLKEVSTLTVTVSDKSNQLEKLQSMKVQGECFRLGVDMLDNWAVSATSVTDIIMKFFSNVRT